MPKSASLAASGEEKTRLAKLADDGVLWAPLPRVECGGYLLHYLQDVGPVMNGAMGAVPLSFSEIGSWADLTGTELQPWEAQMLRRLSLVYLAQSQRSTAHDCPSPWVAPVLDREAISARVSSFFSAMARKGKPQ